MTHTELAQRRFDAPKETIEAELHVAGDGGRGWPRVALRELVIDSQYGTAAKSNEARLGQPVLRMNNITYDGRFDLTDIKWVELPGSEAKKLDLRRGDVLFNRTNSRELVGKTAVWQGPENFTFAGYLVRLRLQDGRILPEWLSAYLNSPAGKKTLFHMAKPSVNMANISASDLLRIQVPVPPLSHQRRSVRLLDKADAIRQKRKAAIALTEELLRSAFLEMFGDPVTNPKGWDLVPLGRLALITTGNTPSRAVPEYFGTDVEWIKSDNINTFGHYLTRAAEGLSAKGRALGRTAPAGSVLMTCIAGSPDCIGNVALADREVAFNQQINAITPQNGMDCRYLYTMLLLGKGIIQAASTKSMKGMVSKGRLEEVRVPCPPSIRQSEFGSVFDCVIGLCRRCESTQSESESLFESILGDVFDVVTNADDISITASGAQNDSRT